MMYFNSNWQTHSKKYKNNLSSLFAQKFLCYLFSLLLFFFFLSKIIIISIFLIIIFEC